VSNVCVTCENNDGDEIRERGKNQNVIVIKETNIINNNKWNTNTVDFNNRIRRVKCFGKNWHLFECTTAVGIRREKPSNRKVKPLSSLRHTTII